MNENKASASTEACFNVINSWHWRTFHCTASAAVMVVAKSVAVAEQNSLFYARFLFFLVTQGSVVQAQNEEFLLIF